MGAWVPHGSTNSVAQNVLIDLRDKTTGSLYAGLVYSNVSLSIVVDSAANSYTAPETLASGTLGSFVSNGFKETAIGGIYQYSLPNSRVATANTRLRIIVTHASIIPRIYPVMVYDAAAGFGSPTRMDANVGDAATQSESQAAAAAALVTAGVTSERLSYVDNLNVGGPVASHADIQNISESASRRVRIKTASWFERPESGSVTYEIEVRTFDPDGIAVNADVLPAVYVIGKVSGDLSANVGAVANVATGVYRCDYTVSFDAVEEQLRPYTTPTIGSQSFELSTYTQVADTRAEVWTAQDRADLQASLTAVQALSTTIGAAGAGLTGLPLSPVTDAIADVQTAVNAVSATLGTGGDGLTDIPYDAITAAIGSLETSLDALTTAVAGISLDNSLSSQAIRDAMRLSPSDGLPTQDGSIDQKLDAPEVAAQLGRTVEQIQQLLAAVRLLAGPAKGSNPTDIKFVRVRIVSVLNPYNRQFGSIVRQNEDATYTIRLDSGTEVAVAGHEFLQVAGPASIVDRAT